MLFKNTFTFSFCLSDTNLIEQLILAHRFLSYLIRLPASLIVQKLQQVVPVRFYIIFALEIIICLFIKSLTCVLPPIGRASIVLPIL